MRILVADQNALLLAAIAATFGRHCEIVTATRRDVCLDHVEQRHFDLVVACEKLAANYTGLELLSEIEAVSPATLRIFAARPETLKRLGSRLDFFGLLGTLHYPIEARKLLIALKVGRSKLPGRPTPPKVKHVVLENEWDTGERLALLGQEIEDAPALEQKPAADQVRRAVHATTAPHEVATNRNADASRATAPAESPAIEESASEFWAAPPAAAVDSAAVERARHIAEASSFDVSFEVSFDENPSRFDITGHASADMHASADPYVSTLEFADGNATSSLNVSFDEDPNSFVILRDKPFEEATSPTATAIAAAPPVAEDDPSYVDLGAANDELFSEASAAGQQPTGRPSPLAAQQAPEDESASAAARVPTAYESALAAAQQASANASASTAPQPAARASAPRKSIPSAAASKPAAATSASAKSASAKQAAAKPTTTKGPRPRQPTTPTAGQREAFQRALARRNAARSGGALEAPPIDFSSMEPLSATRPAAKKDAAPRSSLSDLARMATTKRPLPGMQRGSHPKRRVFVVGSGIAAVLLVAVISFELLRASPSGEHGRHGRGAANAQLFSPRSTLVAENGSPPPQVFSPPPPPSAATQAEPRATSTLPQPQTFDPDTAPPDPPPPPALESPGPMEPPSPGHMGSRPPWVPQGGDSITQ